MRLKFLSAITRPLLTSVVPMKHAGGGRRGPAPSGVLLRSEAHRMVAQLAAVAARQASQLIAFWLDVDRFRQINDTFGHASGDEVVAVLSRRLLAVLPPGAQCFRMGSDEFVALAALPSCSEAEWLARTMGTEIERPLSVQGVNIHLTVSIGLHAWTDGESASQFLARADRAMFVAKRMGGNRFEWAREDHRDGGPGAEQSKRELMVASMLHDALLHGGLALRYQPIVGADGRIEAVEALMSCSSGGVPVSPGEFIPVAEKIGLIDKLGEWSLMEGALCAARLLRQGMPTKVAINVSRAQLLSEAFLSALQGALLCANVPPQWIELELTESLFMEQSPTVQQNVQRIRETGVGLAIDDFGTGYSCLATLKDLPATKLKFDKAFIQCLPDDTRVLAIVRSMTDLAHFLGLVVVAEGVETDEQLRVCEDAGLDATQGYFHARPMPEGQLTAWLESHHHER